MQRKIKFIIFVLVLSLPLSWLLRDFVLKRILMLAFKLYNSFRQLDQNLIWWFLIGIIIFIGGKSFVVFVLHLLRNSKTKTEKKGMDETPIEKIALLLITARNTVFFRKQLVWNFQDKILAVLDHQEGLSVATVKEHLKLNTLNVPPEIAGFLNLRFNTASSNFWKKFGMTFTKTKKQRHGYGFDPETIVNFLEERLDIKNDKPD